VTSVANDRLEGLTPEQRLQKLGIELPPAAPAVGDYAPTAIAGSLLMTSGQLPWIAGDLKFKGKIGAELTPEQGYQAFRLSALNAIAQIKAALGSLDRVNRSCGSRARWAVHRASPHSPWRSMALRRSSIRSLARAAATRA
jgi:hypothetical protein